MVPTAQNDSSSTSQRPRRQRAAHADPRQETQEQQPRELRREGRCHAGAGVDDHGDHQNRTAPDAVGHPAEHERADQHADKEERAALQCLRHAPAWHPPSRPGQISR
ncbi:hypothetical protein G6F24_017668 [Rhizopus arrhizus]|nr:hypothetical protein G6F24_017668 [Rhizopus arrhizus]